MIQHLLKPRTFLRRLLGVEPLDDRLREVESLVRVWASRSGESTALDQAIERIEQLISHLPADAGTEQMVAELRDSMAVRDRASEIADLHRRIDQLEERLLESHEEIHERSRQRWRAAQPDDRLTWMQELSGDPFISKLEEYDAFGEGKTVVEIGPGYGRLLRSLLDRQAAFATYFGVDLSAENLQHLQETFIDPRLNFLHADVEKVQIETPIDVVYSSLTFKHFYPSFQLAVQNLTEQMSPNGRLFIDLVEGRKRYFEADGVTYLRFYEKQEIVEIFGRCGLEVEAFDEVLHDEHHPRLLAIGRRAS